MDSLKETYEKDYQCEICLMNRKGREMCFLDNCTHSYCAQCIIRVENRHRCAICKAQLDLIQVIDREGERYKISIISLTESAPSNMQYQKYSHFRRAVEISSNGESEDIEMPSDDEEIVSLSDPDYIESDDEYEETGFLL